MKTLAITLAAGLLTGLAGNACAQTIVDGFSVSTLPVPTRPTLPIATNVLGAPAPVLYLTGTSTFGSSPYPSGTRAYLSVQKGSLAAFRFTAPKTVLNILWGSIGSADNITFYSHGLPVGQLFGADLIGPFGANQSHYFAITSPVPFSAIAIGSGGSCCFEFADLSVQ